MAAATAEISWVQHLLHELKIPLPAAPKLCCDNLSATYLIANPVFHARTKHIEMVFHFVKEKVASKDLTVCYISSLYQVADTLTKSLSVRRFLFLRDKLPVVDSQLHLKGNVRIANNKEK